MLKDSFINPEGDNLYLFCVDRDDTLSLDRVKGDETIRGIVISSPTSPSTEDVKKLVDGEKVSGMKLVCRSFPYSLPLKDEPLTEYKKYLACEGSIIRIFYATNRWWVSSHKRLDAKKTRWGGPDFYTLFSESLNKIVCDEEFNLETFVNELDKRWCYIFLFHSVPHRIVCDDT